MPTDKRNFRSAYYEKVGCRGVEEKKSLELLMSDIPWDKVKLKQFCLRFCVPAAYRNLVWKVLFGILPLYPDTHAFIWEQRSMQYCDLMDALEILEIQSKDRADALYNIWQLETGKVRSDPIIEASFKAIATTLAKLYNDEKDVYWFTKSFCKEVKSFLPEVPKMMDTFAIVLEKEDYVLYRHLLSLKCMEVLPLNKWFQCCFAGLLDEVSLAKIWDKICCGSSKILPYVGVTLVITLRRCILQANSTEELLKCMQELPEQCEDVLANKAIDLWQHYGALQGDPHIKK